MYDEVKTTRTFVIDTDDNETYIVEVFPARTYVSKVPLKEGHPEEVLLSLSTDGLPELFERLAAFIRAERDRA